MKETLSNIIKLVYLRITKLKDYNLHQHKISKKYNLFHYELDCCSKSPPLEWRRSSLLYTNLLETEITNNKCKSTSFSRGYNNLLISKN